MEAGANTEYPALEAEHVSVTYDGRRALEDVSLRVSAGGMVGVIGPNGAGKTTLLRVLGGSWPCRSGCVRVNGREVASFRKRELARILAFVPQAVEIPVAYTVGDVVAMGRTPYVSGWAPFSPADREAVRRALALMEVSPLADRPMDELSAGERQRAIVAMALAQEPHILLLDEPTAHLDIQHAWTLMEQVVRMNRERGVAVVVSLHDLNLAAEFCSELLLLDGGAKAASGLAGAVLRPEILQRVYRHPIEAIRRDNGRTAIVPGSRAGHGKETGLKSSQGNKKRTDHGADSADVHG